MSDLLWAAMTVLLILNLLSARANWKTCPFVVGINVTSAAWILAGMLIMAARSLR